MAGKEQKFMTMYKQAVMWKHGVQMQFVKVFLGPSVWGVTVYKIICCVYLYGVHVQPVVICVCRVQNCYYKTKES